VLLGDLGIRTVLLQQYLSFDAQKLGDVPTLLFLLAALKALVNGRTTLGYVPGAGKTFSKKAEKSGTIESEQPAFLQLVQRATKQPNPTSKIALLDA
jgi:hypothetical protein